MPIKLAPVTTALKNSDLRAFMRRIGLRRNGGKLTNPCWLQHISFVLQSNTSANWFKGQYQNPNTYCQLPLQMAVERETARYLANSMATDSICNSTLLPTNGHSVLPDQ